MSEVQRPRRKVLVVDDEAVFRETVTEYLRVNGFEVLEAPNGLEALLQLKRNRPAAVVLDLAMPRLGGLETLGWIRSFDPAATVVIVTGVDDAEAHRRAREMGATAVLRKPVDFDELLRVLSSAASAAPSSPRVLVVDDDAETRHMLGEFLATHGFDARSAADGGAALRAITQEPPDVVLLDIAMPGLSGLEALPAIRAIAPDVKVIMVSGVATVEMAKLALARGAFDYVGKPIDFAYLTQAIATAVAMKRVEAS